MKRAIKILCVYFLGLSAICSMGAFVWSAATGGNSFPAAIWFLFTVVAINVFPFNWFYDAAPRD